MGNKFHSSNTSKEQILILFLNLKIIKPTASTPSIVQNNNFIPQHTQIRKNYLHKFSNTKTHLQ